jgi:hypothetical protein
LPADGAGAFAIAVAIVAQPSYHDAAALPIFCLARDVPGYHAIDFIIIHKMINIVKQPLHDDELAFIDEMASLLTPWGMAVSSGRVYGYLLLKQKPVGLDQIGTDLRMSKVSAWKAARDLADFGHVRRYGEPGSKRALYGPTDNFDTPFQKQCSLLGALGRLLRIGAASVGGGETAERLQEMARFYLSLQQTMESTIRDLNAQRNAQKS